MARIRRSSNSIKHQSTKSQSLKTRRLQLRKAHRSDLADLHQLLSSCEVMRYWACPTHTSIDQTKEYLDGMIASSTNGDIEFVIVLPAPMPPDPSSTVVSKGKVIGTAGVWDEATGEIEFMLHSDYWAQGYMSEVLTTLIPILWQRGAQKLLADVDPRNHASIKVLNRFGFVETHRKKKTFETDIGWCDSIYLELWRPRRF